MAVAELQMLAKKQETEDSQYLLSIANSLTRHSTMLEGRIKERHEAICQLFNQMLGALEEINNAYYAHSVELIDIAASLSARAKLVRDSSLTPDAIEVAPVVHWQGRIPSGPYCRLRVEDDRRAEMATNGAGTEHGQENRAVTIEQSELP
jgi:hypothetical protein